MPDIPEIEKSAYIPSILTSIKQELGIPEDYTHFDSELIPHINTALSIAYQLGVGVQDKPFRIEDKTATWEDFLNDSTNQDMVQSQVYVRVKQLFDPASSSHVSQSQQNILNELDWRSNVAAEEE